MSGKGRPSASSRPWAVAAPLPARHGAGHDARDDPRDSSWVGRSLRLPVFVGVTTLLGVVAHALVERSVPQPALLGLAVLAVTCLSLTLRGRERSFEAIGLALAAGQVVVHAVLCLSHAGAQAAAGSLAHAGHAGHAAPNGYLAHLYPGHSMLLAHLLAAGVAAWWLRQGEAAVWAAVGWIWPALQTLPVLTGVVDAPASRPRPGTGVRALRSQVEGARANPRRGPPARVLASRAPAVA